MINHAKRELAILQSEEEDELQEQINKNILDIVELFLEQNHSGTSASYVVGILDRLLRFEPISPLTGEDDEWNHVGENYYQNKRCSHVFKENGQAIDINGKLFSDDGDVWYSNNESAIDIEFPYFPTEPEYILRKE